MNCERTKRIENFFLRIGKEQTKGVIFSGIWKWILLFLWKTQVTTTTFYCPKFCTQWSFLFGCCFFLFAFCFSFTKDTTTIFKYLWGRDHSHSEKEWKRRNTPNLWPVFSSRPNWCECVPPNCVPALFQLSLESKLHFKGKWMKRKGLAFFMLWVWNLCTVSSGFSSEISWSYSFARITWRGPTRIYNRQFKYKLWCVAEMPRNNVPAYVEQTTSSYPAVATTPPCTDVTLSLHGWKQHEQIWIHSRTVLQSAFQSTLNMCWNKSAYQRRSHV